jgi:hypothetical protein
MWGNYRWCGNVEVYKGTTGKRQSLNGTIKKSETAAKLIFYSPWSLIYT